MIGDIAVDALLHEGGEFGAGVDDFIAFLELPGDNHHALAGVGIASLVGGFQNGGGAMIGITRDEECAAIKGGAIALNDGVAVVGINDRDGANGDGFAGGDKFTIDAAAAGGIAGRLVAVATAEQRGEQQSKEGKAWNIHDNPNLK